MIDNRLEILQYIEEEKEIAKFQIQILEKYKDFSASKRRLLDIEREFIALPLEEMNFEDVTDVAAAISIYRTSRNLFYQSYKISQKLSECSPDKILERYNFIKNLSDELMNVRVQEVNLVQNFDLYSDLIKRQAIKNSRLVDLEKKDLDAMNLKMLLEIEPAILSKKRARIQLVFYSIGRYLREEINKISISSAKLEQFDTIIDNIKHNIFKYYNDGINILPNQLVNTMGENVYLSKTHYLQNILDFSKIRKNGIYPMPLKNSENFSNQSPMLGNIMFGNKKLITYSLEKDAERKVKNKIFGILLPVLRKGNEKMTLLYKNIIFQDTNISHLFSSSVSNVKALRGNKEVYFKAILMEPIWKIINEANIQIILSKLLNAENIDFQNLDVVSKINNKHSGYYPISNQSIVLTAKTRSEEEGLSEIFPIINGKILEINQDYAKLLGNDSYLE